MIEIITLGIQWFLKIFFILLVIDIAGIVALCGISKIISKHREKAENSNETR